MNVKILLFFLFIVIFPNLGFSLSSDFEVPIKEINGNSVRLLNLTWDDQTDSSENVHYYPGLSLGFIDDLTNNEQYTMVGADYYAKISVGNVWSRWGAGFVLFNRQSEQLSTPWDLHFSLQSGYRWTESFNFILGFHHWSNARGLAKILNIEKYWPPNNGGDAFTVGVNYKW